MKIAIFQFEQGRDCPYHVDHECLHPEVANHVCHPESPVPEYCPLPDIDSELLEEEIENG